MNTHEGEGIIPNESPAQEIATIMVNDTLIRQGENIDHLKGVLDRLHSDEGVSVTKDAMGDYFGTNEGEQLDPRVREISPDRLSDKDVADRVIALFENFLSQTLEARAHFLLNLRSQK